LAASSVAVGASLSAVGRFKSFGVVQPTCQSPEASGPCVRFTPNSFLSAGLAMPTVQSVDVDATLRFATLQLREQ
jgi:hypothetical protein